ncbi:MAG TPA: DUF4476 domain-containing protein [Bacteroidia bacterium]|jgi:hypothetical protein|nr:DUF4476 domain-containing protein [Bacteroidia bacterium]
MKKLLLLVSLFTFTFSVLTPCSAQTKTRTKTQPAQTTTTSAASAKETPYTGPKGCPAAMSAEEFAGVKKEIGDESDVDNVIVIAKKAATAHCYSVEQIKDILKLLKNDDNRFEFFKAVYTHIYDQNRYSQLGDSFLNAAYKDKIRTYVNSLE